MDQVDRFKSDYMMMVMKLSDGPENEICFISIHLHQHTEEFMQKQNSESPLSAAFCAWSPLETDMKKGSILPINITITERMWGYCGSKIPSKKRCTDNSFFLFQK